MKKIIFLSSMNNENQKGGGYIRIDSFKKLYNRLGFNITEVFQEQVKKKKTVKSFFFCMYYGRNLSLMFNSLKTELPKGDILHLDNLKQFFWFNDDELERYFVVYNAHNLEFENYFGRDRNKKYLRFAKYELTQMKKSNIVFVCSNRERDLLIGMDNELEDKIYVFPNLVDSGKYYESPLKKCISFIGTLSYFPNVRAIEYLCAKFMKEIPCLLKEKYRFIIAGRDPLDHQEQMIKKAGFECLINLTDAEISDLYAKTEVLLVPLESGSGTRLKIIEAIFSGAKVISTPLGAEGIESELIDIADLENFAMRFIECLKKQNGFKRIKYRKEFTIEFDQTVWLDRHLDRISLIIKNSL